MSGNIIDHVSAYVSSDVTLALGMTFVTRDQKVMKIVEHREWLEGQAKKESWITDTGLAYSGDVVGMGQESPNDILLEMKGDVNVHDIQEAFMCVSRAERILNPVGLAVDVHPAKEELLVSA